MSLELVSTLVLLTAQLKLTNLLFHISQRDYDYKPTTSPNQIIAKPSVQHKPHTALNNGIHPQTMLTQPLSTTGRMEVDPDQDSLAFLAEMLMETTTAGPYQPPNFAAVMTTSPSVHNLQYTASPPYYSNPASMQASLLCATLLSIHP